MAAALQLARSVPEITVIGIPKTIDNDIVETDHTPGYGSAARFAAHFARDAGEDNRSLPSPIMVLEVVGRNVGWVVAATSLARHRPDDPPHLIYFPERRVSTAVLLADVERVYRRLGRAVIAVCEGQLDERGTPFGADLLPNVPLAANLGHTLARLITQELGVRARAERPGLLGRSCAALTSEVDRRYARMCGRAAAQAADDGLRGVMITIRGSDTGTVPLEQVAGRERALPTDWISPDGNDVLPAFAEYARPLVGDIPAHPIL